MKLSNPIQVCIYQFTDKIFLRWLIIWAWNFFIINLFDNNLWLDSFFALITLLLRIDLFLLLPSDGNVIVVNFKVVIVLDGLRVEVQVVVRGLFVGFLAIVSILVVVDDLLIDKFLVNVVFLVLHRFPVILTHLDRVVSLLMIVIEGTYLGFVASASIAVDSLILVRMVKSLNCRVTFVAENSIWTHFPTRICIQIFTILCRVFEDLRRSSKVTHVMSINAVLRVVRILAVWTPSWLIFEHVERKNFHGLEGRVQILIKGLRVEQAIQYEVIFDALALKFDVLSHHQLVVLPSEAFEIVRWPIQINSNN